MKWFGFLDGVARFEANTAPARARRLAGRIAFGTACAIAGGAAFAGDATAGAEKAKQVCAACHGVDGTGVQALPDYPKLAGQHEDYLLQALKQYKSGARKNPIMGGMVQPLSEKDMNDLAAYFSEQKGTLFVQRESILR
jgi:cytochrome c553